MSNVITIKIPAEVSPAILAEIKEQMLSGFQQSGFEISPIDDSSSEVEYMLVHPEFLRGINIYKEDDYTWCIRLLVASGYAEWGTAIIYCKIFREQLNTIIYLESKELTDADLAEMETVEWQVQELSEELDMICRLAEQDSVVQLTGRNRDYSIGPEWVKRWGHLDKASLQLHYISSMEAMQQMEESASIMQIGRESKTLLAKQIGKNTGAVSANDVDFILFNMGGEGVSALRFIHKGDIWKVFPPEWLWDEYTIIPDDSWNKIFYLIEAKGMLYGYNINNAFARMEEIKTLNESEEE